MHGHSVFLQTFQLPALVAAVLINLQQLPSQLLLNLNLHACVVTHSESLVLWYALPLQSTAAHGKKFWRRLGLTAGSLMDNSHTKCCHTMIPSILSWS